MILINICKYIHIKKFKFKINQQDKVIAIKVKLIIKFKTYYYFIKFKSFNIKINELKR